AAAPVERAPAPRKLVARRAKPVKARRPKPEVTVAPSGNAPETSGTVPPAALEQEPWAAPNAPAQQADDGQAPAPNATDQQLPFVEQPY
ncbi:MAG TPA: hypothetical protein VNN80_01580, partial [Polyangiaceae bacterium]|nr:hypothetical protein [Polyangiaceae bacterium]